MTNMKPVAVPALRAARPRATHALWRKLACGAAALATIARAYRQQHRERRQLLALSDRELRDIGISRIDAVRAADRPFWRRG